MSGFNSLSIASSSSARNSSSAPTIERRSIRPPSIYIPSTSSRHSSRDSSYAPSPGSARSRSKGKDYDDQNFSEDEVKTVLAHLDKLNHDLNLPKGYGTYGSYKFDYPKGWTHNEDYQKWQENARQTLKKQSLRGEHRFGDGAVPKTFLPKIRANILPARKLQVAGRTMTAMPLQNILVHQARAKTAAV